MVDVVVHTYHGDRESLRKGLKHYDQFMHIVFADLDKVHEASEICSYCLNGENCCYKRDLPESESRYNGPRGYIVKTIPQDPHGYQGAVVDSISEVKLGSGETVIDLTSGTLAEAYRMGLATMLLDAKVCIGYENIEVVSMGNIVLKTLEQFNVLETTRKSTVVTTAYLKDKVFGGQGSKSKDIYRKVNNLVHRGLIEPVVVKFDDEKMNQACFGPNGPASGLKTIVLSKNRKEIFNRVRGGRKGSKCYSVTEEGKFAERLNRRLGHLWYKDKDD